MTLAKNVTRHDKAFYTFIKIAKLENVMSRDQQNKRSKMDRQLL
jgi:hypothetical protein